MRPLAIIPARAGSKRLPHKNQEMIDGQTLVDIAAMTAYQTHLFDTRVIVSSDYEEGQLRIGPAIFWDQRPRELCTDETPMMDVVRHVVHKARDYWHLDFDSVVLLQPSSPLRTALDIMLCVHQLEERHCEAVVSVVETRNPEVYTTGHSGRLRPVTTHVDGRRLMIPNGAVFAIRTDALDRGLDWWTAGWVYGYEMPAERSVDIDSAADLELARKLWPTR